MMNETFNLMPALATGLLTGAIFFGGLWWTVRKWVSAKKSALWFLGSLLLRMGIVVAGFIWVSDGQWERFLACLPGFVLMRFIVIGITPAAENNGDLGKEAGHALDS
jgi:F1F0 ATPase subunit 2